MISPDYSLRGVAATNVVITLRVMLFVTRSVTATLPGWPGLLQAGSRSDKNPRENRSAARGLTLHSRDLESFLG